MKTLAATLAGVVLAVLIVACGGARKASVPATNQTGGAMPLPVTGDSHSQIEQLDADIKANLDRLQIPESIPWSATSDTAPDPRPMSAVRDVCNVGSHICDNATRICDLAAELQPDDWATTKCDSGKKSCEAARKRCCDCL